MSEVVPAEIRSTFNDDEIAKIQANTVWIGGETRRDTLALTVAWDQNVAKIDRDRALPSSDHSVWTEHDLAGALFIRDHLEKALNQLEPALRDRMRRYVAKADDRFRSFTVEDPRRRMAKVAEVDPAGRSWWWFRVPESGPIAEELAKY